MKRLLCDAGVHRVITEGASTILDHGRATRTIPPRLWAAVVLRDRTCRHPGCDRGPEWCDAHHVEPWSQGGPTDLANLLLGCSRHHHMWHSQGWEVKLLPDGEAHFTAPDGRVWITRPPP
ncbi:MAG: HNH endonuclease [Actinomycetota bacterium]|nr:HNH endonuclease [Actinomycetota bacterium]